MPFICVSKQSYSVYMVNCNQSGYLDQPSDARRTSWRNNPNPQKWGDFLAFRFAMMICRLPSAPAIPTRLSSVVVVVRLGAHVWLFINTSCPGLKRPTCLANETCAESTFDQNISIAVYMTAYSGYKRSNPALTIGFLKIGICAYSGYCRRLHGHLQSGYC